MPDRRDVECVATSQYDSAGDREPDHSTRDWFAGIAIAVAIFFLTAAALGWLAP